ncbi:MAG: hypothetical protein IKP60_14110 [Treponema sp.]|nr:hypothetical protein [Treponema sp.]
MKYNEVKLHSTSLKTSLYFIKNFTYFTFILEIKKRPRPIRNVPAGACFALSDKSSEAEPNSQSWGQEKLMDASGI